MTFFTTISRFHKITNDTKNLRITFINFIILLFNKIPIWYLKFSFLYSSGFSDEIANNWSLDSHVNRRSRSVSAYCRAEADNTDVNSFTNNCTARVSLTAINSVFSSCAEHAVGDVSPGSVAVCMIMDGLLNLKEIVRNVACKKRFFYKLIMSDDNI